jgi:selenocysteine-specific elongation factor
VPVERHVIFGTAGHVDHGKSALVLALTGTDPDRLAEEKAREMTIDLGFAFLPLPGLESPVAIVDVPGHEMFVRNMVAGATGIDAAIFVIAADEGVMPQTVEHLDVLRCLQVPAGVVALTKVDKAAPERVGEVTNEARRLVADTFLRDARIVPVSSVTSQGLAELREELGRIALDVRPRSAEGIFRLPVDRVFTLKGVGVVVTGTVISGALSAGQTVALLPQGRDLRARSLQVHNETVNQVSAGQRAAVNLADVEKDEIERGDVLTTPGSLAPTLMMDVRLMLSARVPKALTQRARVRIHHGTKEVMARVVLLEGESLEPGQSALAQLRLESPLVAVAGDLFVMRSYSPMRVIGGGGVVDAHPPKRRPGGDVQEVAERETLDAGDIVIEMLDRAGARGASFDDLRVSAGLSESALREHLSRAAAGEKAVAGRRDLWFSAGAVEEMQSTVAARLAALHTADPLRAFIPLSTVSGAVTTEQRECFRLALDALSKHGTVVVAGERARLSSHTPQWTGRLAEARRIIVEICRAAGLAAPTLEELAIASKLNAQECRRVLDALVDADELVALAPGIYIHSAVMQECRARLVDFLRQHGQINISQCRDLLGASRKYLLPFLERLDAEGVTIRRGDYRVLRQAPSTAPPR